MKSFALVTIVTVDDAANAAQSPYKGGTELWLRYFVLSKILSGFIMMFITYYLS